MPIDDQTRGNIGKCFKFSDPSWGTCFIRVMGSGYSRIKDKFVFFLEIDNASFGNTRTPPEEYDIIPTNELYNLISTGEYIEISEKDFPSRSR